MEILTIAASVLSMMLSVSDNQPYYHNTETINEHVRVTETFQKESDYLEKYSKSTCTYDDTNRLVCKETSFWDKSSGSWVRKTKYTYSYDEMGYTVEFFCWDGQKQQYVPVAKTVYQEVSKNFLSMSTYKWDTKSKAFAMDGNPILMCPNNVLYATTN